MSLLLLLLPFVVQSLSHVRLFVTPWTEACQASLSLSISRSSPKFMSAESVILSNYLILCHPLLLLPSIFPTIMVFSNESALHIRWPTYWSFSISLSNDYSGLFLSGLTGLISLLFKGLSKVFPAPQFESMSSSVLSHLYGATLTLYMATGKAIALTMWIFVGKSDVLVFNMLFRFVIAFLPRSKCLLI